MEEDDDFGDLYTDVVRLNPTPTLLPATQKPPPVPPAATAVDTSAVGNVFIHGVEESDSILNRSSLLAAPVRESASVDREQQVSADNSDDNWLLGRDPLPVEEPANWIDDDEEVTVDRVNRVAVGGFPSVGSGARVPVKKDAKAVSVVSKEEMDALEGSGTIEKTPEIQDSEDEPVIPGLSGAPATSEVPNGMLVKACDSDDWDSGSEDDLQIVLNDTGHDMRGAERGDGVGSDEDDEDLVIVTDDQHHHHHQAIEDQDWGDDGVQSSVDGEKKEILEGAKGSGAPPTASGSGLGYSNHGFHSQHHSMFKYVRPGATTTPRGPAAVAAGALGQVRPPAFGSLAGRGRGDWRPSGGSSFVNMQKGFHSGYGLPTWGNSASGRPFGSGLDFFLPSHKTVFDVDIESFEEKPWRHPGVDVSDFFNFGLDEEHWKEYCKQVEQLRLESTMQSKIRVYESGRSEQDYDPDLPPELAAAAGHNNMSTDNINLGKSENGPAGLNEQGAISSMRPALPTGRAIQVESGFGERLPSIDTRAPRIRDSDAVIEIVLQDNMDDSRNSNGAFERPDNNFERENQKDFHDEDERPIESEFYGRFPRGPSVQPRESMALRIPISTKEDGILPLPSEFSRPSNSNPKSRRPAETDKSFGTHHGGRSLRTSHGKNSSSSERLSETLPIQNLHLHKHEELQKEKPSDAMESNRDTESSPANNCEIVRELSTEPKDVEHDDRFTLGDSHEGDGEEEASDFRLSSETGGEDGLNNSANRKKLSSCVEQYGAQDNGFGEDSRLTHSDNSRARSRSGNSRDYRKTNETGEEVMQVHPSKHMGELRKHPEEDDRRRRDEYNRDGRREMVKNRSRGREIMHESASGHTFRARTEGFEREMDDSVGVWHRREDDTRNNRQLKDRSKVRMADRKEKVEEHGDWIGHGRDDGVRHRDRNEILMNRRENLEDGEMKRKRDVEPKRERSDKEDSLHGYRAREDSHRRRRVRDDIVDHRKREEEVRTKGNKQHKDDNWYQRDREDRQQLNLAHDDALALQGRDERRFASRSKILGGSGRSKEDLKVAAPDKLYHDKDRRRHGEPSKKSDRTGEENDSLNKVRGDTHNREKRFGAEKRSMRHDRLSARHDRPSGVTDEQQVQKERHRESNRKVGESEAVAQKRDLSSKRKRGDHSTHRTEFNSKGSGEQHSTKHSAADGKKVNGNAEKPGSDDESDDSRRGRSKLERWTSHKERDYSIVESTVQPSSIIREVEDPREEVNEPVKPDAAMMDSTDANVDDSLQVSNKGGEDRDRHLDTVAKLKMRSERFKLPMPGEKEKEFTGNKKVEGESPASIQNDAASAASAASASANVKLERPARKRKWTGS